MTLNVELSYVLTLAGLLGGAFWAMAKLLLTQSQKQIEHQFEQMNGQFKAIQAHMQLQDDQSRRLEREVLELKAILPRDYVRREDYTQAIATIITKLDAMALRYENLILRNGDGR
jgi:hypothetical protein